ncbi:MAG: ADP-ribosylglycohydrolase family protein, partial [Myxococcota bacterium]
MKRSAREVHASGALLGLAIGEALARGPTRERTVDDDAGATDTSHEPRNRVHGAMTTWTLTVIDALLYRAPQSDLAADLSLRLCALVHPLDGAALRGRARTLSGDLRRVALALQRGDDRRLCGVDVVSAAGMVGALPFALALSDDDDAVASAIGDVVGLTHRNPRVVSAAALLAGGLRHRLRAPLADGDDVLEAAASFAQETLRTLRASRRGTTLGGTSEAEGALMLALAAGRGARDPREVLPPPGYDGRDAPEHVALAALHGSFADATTLLDVVDERLKAEGDCDVVVPLLLGAYGAARGADHLPLSLVGALATRPLVVARAAALYEPRPPRLPPLVVEELRLSAWEAASSPAPPPLGAAPSRRGTQL